MAHPLRDAPGVSERNGVATGEFDRRDIRSIRPEFSRSEDLCAYAELVIAAALTTCARSRELREKIQVERAERASRRGEGASGAGPSETRGLPK